MITIFDETLPLSCVAALATAIVIAAAILMFGLGGGLAGGSAPDPLHAGQ